MLFCISMLGSMNINAVETADTALWHGDFETGDFTQWSYQLNADHIQVSDDLYAQGKFAAKLMLDDNATWPNGMRRSELKFQPEKQHTQEGSISHFAWQFYLPKKLPKQPATSIGYWESDQSWQQVMAFEVRGKQIAFYTRLPDNRQHWLGKKHASAGRWHQIAIQILWSRDVNIGRVSVWFNGENVVCQASAQTLADQQQHFIQVGMLREQAMHETLTMYVDNALQAASLKTLFVPSVAIQDTDLRCDINNAPQAVVKHKKNK